MGRTCGEPNEIRKNTHPKNITVLFHGSNKVGAADGLWLNHYFESKNMAGRQCIAIKVS